MHAVFMGATTASPNGGSSDAEWWCLRDQK